MKKTKARRKAYPTVVQSIAQIPDGFVRAHSLCDGGKTEEGRKRQSMISLMVWDGKISAYKLAPPPDAKPTHPDSWPLYVHPDEVDAEVAAKETRKRERQKKTVAPDPIPSEEINVRALAHALSVVVSQLRDEMALLRQAISSLEASLLDQATRPLVPEEVTA